MPRKYIKRYIPKYKEDDIVVSIKDHHKLRYMKGDIFRIDEDYSDLSIIKKSTYFWSKCSWIGFGIYC